MTAGVTEPKAAAELPHWDMSNVYSGLNQDDSTRALRWQSWLAAALILNRMDTVLFVAPVLALAVWRLKPRGVWRPALPPLLVCGAWFGFATIYYGSPFPNTAAAKLGSGASLGELIELGWHYLAASLREDPVTLVTIQPTHSHFLQSFITHCTFKIELLVTATAGAVFLYSRRRKAAAAAIGSDD